MTKIAKRERKFLRVYNSRIKKKKKSIKVYFLALGARNFSFHKYTHTKYIVRVMHHAVMKEKKKGKLDVTVRNCWKMRAALAFISAAICNLAARRYDAWFYWHQKCASTRECCSVYYNSIVYKRVCVCVRINGGTKACERHPQNAHV